MNGRAPFFDARIRDDAAYVRFDETTYRFLDRVDDVFFARVRDLLNQWFAELGDEELEVELEPGRDHGRQPDFRGWPPAREENDFLLGPRAIGDPPTARAKQRRLQQAWDSVNAAAPAGFMVHMRRVTPGNQNPSGVRLRNQILPWLQSLDRAALRAPPLKRAIASYLTLSSRPGHTTSYSAFRLHLRPSKIGSDLPASKSLGKSFRPIRER